MIEMEETIPDEVFVRLFDELFEDLKSIEQCDETERGEEGGERGEGGGMLRGKGALSRAYDEWPLTLPPFEEELDTIFSYPLFSSSPCIHFIIILLLHLVFLLLLPCSSPSPSFSLFVTLLSALLHSLFS